MTKYDFIEGESELLLFPVKEEKSRSKKPDYQQAIRLGWGRTLDTLGKAGRLTGKALALWRETRKLAARETEVTP